MIMVQIDNPVSVNDAFATDFKTGRRFLTLAGKKYAGEKRDKPARGKIKKMVLIEGENYRQLTRGKIYVYGDLFYAFKKAGVPIFGKEEKVVINAWAIWPDKRSRDMSNLQKLAEDVLEKGGFIPNDSYLLWRNQDFRFETGIHRLIMQIDRMEGE